MTPDVIGAIFAAFGAAATVLAGVWAINGRMMKGLDARFERVDARFDKVDARFERVDAELAAVRGELVEVKIAVARLEGPPQRILHVRA